MSRESVMSGAQPRTRENARRARHGDDDQNARPSTSQAPVIFLETFQGNRWEVSASTIRPTVKKRYALSDENASLQEVKTVKDNPPVSPASRLRT